jgi:hypothetical protein
VLVGEKGIVVKARDSIVKRKGVGGLNLYAADTTGFHCPKLPL